MKTRKKLFVLCFTLLVFLAAILRFALSQSPKNNYWLGAEKEQDFIISGIFTGDRISGDGYSLYYIDMKEIIFSDGSKFQASGKIGGEYYHCDKGIIINRYDRVVARCSYLDNVLVITSIEPVITDVFGISSCRRSINEIWNKATQSLTVYNRALADALIFGNQENLPALVRSLFRTNGCAHLLAMSGLHLGILVLCFRFVFRLIPWKWVSDSIILLILASYLYLCSFSPSLTRSVLFFSFLLLNRIFSLKIRTSILLIWTLLFQIILFPENFFSLSFQLSYSAFWGLIVFSSIYGNFFAKQMPTRTASALSGSCSSQLGSYFFVLCNIGKVYPAGLIMSLILTPFIAVYMIICYLFLFFYIFNITSVFRFLQLILESIYRSIYSILIFGEKWAFLEISSIYGCCLYLFILIIPLLSVIIKRKRGLNLLKDIPYENNRLQFRTGNNATA